MTTPTDEFPLVPSELIEALEQMFPAVDWDVKAELKDVLHYAGKRDIVRYLRLQHEVQHEVQPEET